LNTNEEYYLKAIKQGNSEIFKELYRLYYEPLCLFANKYFDNISEAEDIVQETFIYIWENRSKSQILNLKTYLFSSVKNACLNRLKHLKVVQKHINATLLDIRILELEQDNTYIEEIQNEDELVNKMLNSLPEQRQKIMRLRYIDGFTSKQIAEKEELSQRTVETHIYKAIKKLMEIFGNKTTLLILIISYFLLKGYVNF